MFSPLQTCRIFESKSMPTATLNKSSIFDRASLSLSRAKASTGTPVCSSSILTQSHHLVSPSPRIPRKQLTIRVPGVWCLHLSTSHTHGSTCQRHTIRVSARHYRDPSTHDSSSPLQNMRSGWGCSNSSDRFQRLGKSGDQSLWWWRVCWGGMDGGTDSGRWQHRQRNHHAIRHGHRQSIEILHRCQRPWSARTNTRLSTDVELHRGGNSQWQLLSHQQSNLDQRAQSTVHCSHG